MPARERSRLTDAAVARLRPRQREYAVWDTRVPGLGVRVRPTGGMTWVMLEDAGGRSRRVSLGPVSTMTVEEARLRYHERRASPETEEFAAPARTAPLFRELVEGAWKEAHFERCKPATRKSYASLLDTRLLPAFGAQPLDRITPARVRRWFDTFSRTAPGNANNALKLLRQILAFAIARGHLDTNPARGIAPNRRPQMNGVPVPVVSKMLGHSNTRMTLRYAHLGDRDIEAAAERVGQAIAAIMNGGDSLEA